MTTTGVRGVLADTSPGLRRAAVLMWSAAVLGTAAGVAGDVLGWWEHLQFLTNLLSSLVGALFGIPVALIVLRRVTATDTRRREAAEALVAARSTAARLVLDLAPLAPDRALAVALDARLRALADDVRPALAGHNYGDQLAKALPLWSSVAADLPAAFADRQDAADTLDDAAATWRYLTRHVVLRLQAAGIGWIPRATADRIDALFAAVRALLRAEPAAGQRLTATVTAALAEGRLDPLADAYGDEYAALAAIRDQAITLASGVGAIVALLDAADRLANEPIAQPNT